MTYFVFKLKAVFILCLVTAVVLLGAVAVKSAQDSGPGGGGASSTTPSPASTRSLSLCKEQMAKDFTHALADPEFERKTRAPECAGVSDDDIKRLAGEVIVEALDSD
jgi:hypothetical protein